MFDKEKRKGVPTRGLLYLIAGVVIGVVGMLIVTSISNRNGQIQEPTSLPVIPTPAMGVAGTASAQTVPTAIPGKRLLGFAVDEQKGVLAVSYESDSIETVLQVHPWPAEGAEQSWVTVEKGTTDYSRLFFDPQNNALLAASPAEALIRTFDLQTKQGQSVSPILQAVYSANGEWFATLSSEREVIVTQRTNGTTTRTLQAQGAAIEIALSSDSEMIAVVSMDREHYHRHHIEVFRLDNLARVKSFTFEAANVSPIAFTADNHLVAAVDTSIRVLSLQDDEQQYFEVETPIRQLAVDATGKWLAVLGGQADAEGHKLITFYSLDDPSTIPPALSMTQTTRMNDGVIGVQFVEEGILVGEAWGNITLYRWTGEVWSEPVMIMENFQ